MQRAKFELTRHDPRRTFQGEHASFRKTHVEVRCYGEFTHIYDLKRVVQSASGADILCRMVDVRRKPTGPKTLSFLG